MKTKTLVAAAFACALCAGSVLAETALKMKMTTDIPAEITTVGARGGPGGVLTRVAYVFGTSA